MLHLNPCTSSPPFLFDFQNKPWYIVVYISPSLRCAMRKIVTFTSDFGLNDSYVAEVKGVISALCGDAYIIDITHGVEPGNIRAASFVLAGSFAYFPQHTLHLAVVDPGVGTLRDIILIESEEYTFIGPDNGILFETAQKAGIRKIRALLRERFSGLLEHVFPDNSVVRTILENGVSSTFHGRDVFAPFVACVLEGIPLDEATVPKKSMVELSLPQPLREAGQTTGEVIYIDRFGNLISNIRGADVSEEDEIFLKTGGEIKPVGRLRETYAQGVSGYPLALIGSRGYLEIGVNGGSAKDSFRASSGDEIILLKKADEDG